MFDNRTVGKTCFFDVGKGAILENLLFDFFVVGITLVQNQVAIPILSRSHVH